MCQDHCWLLGYEDDMGLASGAYNLALETTLDLILGSCHLGILIVFEQGMSHFALGSVNQAVSQPRTSS